MPRVPEPVKRAMTVDILRGDIAALPSADRLVCADEDVYRAYSFQWNMWFAERKPEPENEA